MFLCRSFHIFGDNGMAKYTQSDFETAWLQMITGFASYHGSSAIYLFNQLTLDLRPTANGGTISIVDYPDYDNNEAIPCGFKSTLWDNTFYITMNELKSGQSCYANVLAWISRNIPGVYQHWKTVHGMLQLPNGVIDAYVDSPVDMTSKNIVGDMLGISQALDKVW
jgi:hypothetical protein